MSDFQTVPWMESWAGCPDVSRYPRANYLVWQAAVKNRIGIAGSTPWVRGESPWMPWFVLLYAIVDETVRSSDDARERIGLLRWGEAA